MKPIYQLLLLTLALSFSCNLEEGRLLNRVEDVLPGNWHIESVELPGYGLGITYEGNTFYNDTILYDVGTIEIAPFDIEKLDLQNPNAPPVPCLLTIKTEAFPYQIKRLFISGDEAFSNFGYAGEGVNIIDTPGEEFIWSSDIFDNNYYIVIIDDNHIRLEKGNNRDGHVLTLERM
ncbi:MAG TPA: hypothetical protein VFF29_04650 [Bacteroidota bacterium]|nr:hypothetical protein [Bacteroidota bacterium]